MNETIEYLDIGELQPFENHPFQLRDGEERTRLLESIRTQGNIEPLIVRPLSESQYEVISGHRRLEVCKELGIKQLPAIVRNLTDAQTITMMVDANLHRENILPSEKAFAYKLKLDAIRHQGKADNITSRQLVGKRESVDMISNTESGRQIQRYIRLTYLIPELLKYVDEGRISFTPAVELSYLTEQEQFDLLNEMEYADATPNLSQAQRLRTFSRQGRLNRDVIFAVMSEEKANQKEQVRFMKEDLQRYFPKSYTGKDMQDTIIKLLDKWQRQREKQREER